MLTYHYKIVKVGYLNNLATLHQKTSMTSDQNQGIFIKKFPIVYMDFHEPQLQQYVN